MKLQRILLFSMGWFLAFMALGFLLILATINDPDSVQPPVVAQILGVVCMVALWPLLAGMFLCNYSSLSYILVPVLVPAGFFVWGLAVEWVYTSVTGRKHASALQAGVF